MKLLLLTAIVFCVAFEAGAQTKCPRQFNEAVLRKMTQANCREAISDCRLENAIELIDAQSSYMVEIANIGLSIAENSR